LFNLAFCQDSFEINEYIVNRQIRKMKL
jgi:hypothetical protein